MKSGWGHGPGRATGYPSAGVGRFGVVGHTEIHRRAGVELVPGAARSGPVGLNIGGPCPRQPDQVCSCKLLSRVVAVHLAVSQSVVRRWVGKGVVWYEE